MGIEWYVVARFEPRAVELGKGSWTIGMGHLLFNEAEEPRSVESLGAELLSRWLGGYVKLEQDGLPATAAWIQSIARDLHAFCEQCGWEVQVVADEQLVDRWYDIFKDTGVHEYHRGEDGYRGGHEIVGTAHRPIPRVEVFEDE